jgi:hypothetical protein
MTPSNLAAFSTRWVFPLVLVAVNLWAGVSLADSVTAMCSKSEDVCSCATKQLRSSVSDEDYKTYENVGASYLAHKAEGIGMADAWDAAVKEEAGKQGKAFSALMKETNALGKAHRKAIKECGA